MIPKLAVEKAREGGWHTTDEDLLDVIDLDWEDFFWQKAAFDPLFWQALGKALGWPKMSCRVHTPQRHTCGIVWTETTNSFAHRFYDLILSGGDTAAFWAELLGQK